jgi:hypothetical protein
MTSDGPPSKPKAPAEARAEREAKLAEALRANLRRRKAAPAPRPDKRPVGDSA